MVQPVKEVASLAVIIPCYNNVETLGEALESVLSQDYPDFEVHVCDNGSTDGSREMISGFRSPRLHAALHDVTLPRTDNWNRAYAAGFHKDYLVTLHADDRLAPGALRAIARATRNRPAMIHGGFRKITYEGQAVGGRSFPVGYRTSGERFRELLLLNNMVAMPGVTVRTNVFRQVGGWSPAWQYLQDMELWWLCSDMGPITYLADVLGDHRDYKLPQARHRHAQEHLAWAMGKLENARTVRLQRAGRDGLATYLKWLEDSDMPLAASEECSAAANVAKLALNSRSGPYADAIRRQRFLRLFAFVRNRFGF